MRFLIPLLLLATPAAAWEFSPFPICILTHDTGEAQTLITFDPSRALPYALAITRKAPWPNTSFFAMRFDVPGSSTITTERHSLSADGRTLTVMDKGFGNVLGGLKSKTSATAYSANAAVIMPLAGAAPEVERFEACTTAPSA